MDGGFPLPEIRNQPGTRPARPRGPAPHWKDWYRDKGWLKVRAHQLATNPLCKFCLQEGKAVVATIVDHVQPHHGDYTKFRLGALQSLCTHHHNSLKRTLERRGYDPTIGQDGYPTDPMHPSNKGHI